MAYSGREEGYSGREEGYSGVGT